MMVAQVIQVRDIRTGDYMLVQDYDATEPRTQLVVHHEERRGYGHGGEVSIWFTEDETHVDKMGGDSQRFRWQWYDPDLQLGEHVQIVVMR